MRNSGEQMCDRFEKLLQFIQKKDWKTGIYKNLIAEQRKLGNS